MVTANNYVTREQIAHKEWKPIEEVPAIFFAKVGAAVLLNRKRLCRFPFLLDNNTMAYSMDGSVFDADFAKTLFETIDLTSLLQVGALPSYNSCDVENIDVIIPEMPEHSGSRVHRSFMKMNRLLVQRLIFSEMDFIGTVLQTAFVIKTSLASTTRWLWFTRTKNSEKKLLFRNPERLQKVKLSVILL